MNKMPRVPKSRRKGQKQVSSMRKMLASPPFLVYTMYLLNKDALDLEQAVTAVLNGELEHCLAGKQRGLNRMALKVADVSKFCRQPLGGVPQHC